MSELTIALPHTRYTIRIEPGVLADTGALCTAHAGGTQACVITDANVAPLYLDRVTSSLQAAGYDVIDAVLPPGEQTKSTAVCDDLYTQLIEGRFERSAVIVALGGGVVGDVAGFIAATYLRGIRFVQVPTSLLAQTDSSVGGKVGVDHRLGKNLIGAFYQPDCVIIDPEVLRTLPPREMSAGMAEVVKYGAIYDAAFLDFLEPRLEALLRLEHLEDVGHIIHRSCEIKAEVVEADEKEGGIRRILNFGHTFGHAIENVTGYGSLLHGEAVNVGMSAALHMSEGVTGLAPEERARFAALLDRLPVPALTETLPVAELIDAMQRDKKVSGGNVRFVLLEQLGRAVVRGDVDTGLWSESLVHALERLGQREPTTGGSVT